MIQTVVTRQSGECRYPNNSLFHDNVYSICIQIWKWAIFVNESTRTGLSDIPVAGIRPTVVSQDHKPVRSALWWLCFDHGTLEPEPNSACWTGNAGNKPFLIYHLIVHSGDRFYSFSRDLFLFGVVKTKECAPITNNTETAWKNASFGTVVRFYRPLDW